MNNQTKPCTDFYDYVCHNWSVYNPRPKDRNLWNIDKWLETRTLKVLKDALENVGVTNGTMYEGAKALYIACMNLPFMERSNSKTKSVMGSLGYWPMFVKNDSNVSHDIPWWQIESYYISKAGESSIVDFHLVANAYKNNQITLFISPPQSPYGMLKITGHFHVSHRKRYKAFLMDVIKSVAPFDIQSLTSNIDADLDEVINFREEIKGITKIPNILNGSTIITMPELQQFYNEYAAGQETARINWPKLISALYQNSKNHYLLSIQNEPKKLVPLSYLSNLAILLATTPKRVIVNHVHLYFAERHVELSKQMETNLENSLILGANPTGKIRYESERWATCISGHNMKKTLGYMYIPTHFPNESKKEVENLLRELVQFLGKRIWESSWLDGTTKSKTMLKLGMLRAQIGYPDWYFPISNSTRAPVLPDINPVYPTVFYAPRANRVSASASYLQWPNYMPNMPYAVKYGATGFVIGHELNHAVDSTGLRFDASGIAKNLWPDSMFNRYNVQSDCFAQQYQGYRNAELKKRNITARPEKSTLNEDIADVMGLKIAYMAYREQLRKNNGNCPVLPGFEEFGCEKLFFIAFGNVFCAASTSSMEEKMLLQDGHSLARIRIHGILNNMPEFQDAFQCKSKNSKEVCDIWK